MIIKLDNEFKIAKFTVTGDKAFVGSQVTLSVNIAKLKSLIEKSNKKYMEELENRIDLEDLWKDFKIVVN